MSVVWLWGCTPEPLGSYLKALAVLRLVSEQKDSSTVGWWEHGFFSVDSSLDEEGLIRFFLEEYRPTPILSPWNGGSGFYTGDDASAIDAIMRDDSARFTLYRECIEKILMWLEMPPILAPEAASTRNIQAASSGQAGNYSTAENRKWREEHKTDIIRACRNRLPDCAVEWVDSAVVIQAFDGPSFPPILGSGGNEGRLDYSKTFMANLVAMLLRPEGAVMSGRLLRNSLFGEPTDGFSSTKVGQYDPGRAGGYNQGLGIEQKDFKANPWDFIFAMEGAIVWSSGLSRREAVRALLGRGPQGTGGMAVSPFTVWASPVGYGSSSRNDYREARGEIWTPVWRRRVGYPELRAVMAQGRAEIGRRLVGTGLEFAEAAASLGVDHGISEFVRYSILKRRGESYVALPCGRFPVTDRKESDLVRDLERVLGSHRRQLSRRLGDKEGARSLTDALRAVDDAIYQLTLRGGPERVKDLIAAVGRMERLLATRGESYLKRPISGLSLKWLPFADDGSLEVRIASAIASIGPSGGVGPIRSNLAPVDPGRPWKWAQKEKQTAWRGNSLAARLTEVLRRRTIDARRLLVESNPTYGSIPLHPEDVAAFIEGLVDEELVEDLLFGLSWVRWTDNQGVSEARFKLREQGWATPLRRHIVPRSWAMLKLLFMPTPIRLSNGKEVKIAAEPSVIRLLRAGRTEEACRLGARRLRSCGIDVPDVGPWADGDGTRIAGALLIPVAGNPLASILPQDEGM
jgi:CRISPR-associated protein Csx17